MLPHQSIFYIKPIVSNLKSFISGTAYVIIFWTHFFSLENGLEDIFLGAPSQDRACQTDCFTYAHKKLVLEVLLAAFLKKRITTLTLTEKRLEAL